MSIRYILAAAGVILHISGSDKIKIISEVKSTVLNDEVFEI